MTDDHDADHDPDLVFERVQACMDTLVGGSGHLASYSLYRDSFEITATRDLGDGLTAYEFAAAADYVSEFTVLAEEADPAIEGSGDDFETGDLDDDEPELPDDDPGRERVAGTVVLDADGALALDDEGRVRIEPWRVLDPELWPRADRDDDLEDLLSELERDRD